MYSAIPLLFVLGRGRCQLSTVNCQLNKAFLLYLAIDWRNQVFLESEQVK